MNSEVYAVTDDANPTAPPVAWVPCPKMAKRLASYLFGEHGRIELSAGVARGIMRETGRALNGGELTPEERVSLFPIGAPGL